MTKQEYTLAGLLNMLVIAQKNMPGNKGKKAALIASSSARKFNKKNGNKKRKPQVPGPSKKIAKQKRRLKLMEAKKSVSTTRRMGTRKGTAQSILLL